MRAGGSINNGDLRKVAGVFGFEVGGAGELGARDAVGVDDERAFFALADVRVEFKGLAKGHPDGRGEILDRRGHPERENIYSAIGLAVVPQRAGNPAGGVFGVPWFHPGAHTLCEVGHDLSRDACVNVLTFCCFCFLHCSFLHKKFFLSEIPRI